MFSSASAGKSTSLRMRYCLSTASWQTSEMRVSTSCGNWPSGPGLERPSDSWRLRPATRISKNSSRLLEKMRRKPSRSSSGCTSSSAWSSTRRLKARMLASRFR